MKEDDADCGASRQVAASSSSVQQRVKKEPSWPWAVTSALIIALPGELHGQVQAVRAKHDKAYHRWMPHINLMFPFVADERDSNEAASSGGTFAAAAALLCSQLADFPAFRLYFDGGLHAFAQGRTQTVHLRPRTEPADAIEQLWRRLKKIFPGYLREARARHELVPHLTIGQWPASQSLADIAAQLRLDRVAAAEIVVDALSIISRYAQPAHFVERFQVRLAAAADVAGRLLTSANVPRDDVAPSAAVVVEYSGKFAAKKKTTPARQRSKCCTVDSRVDTDDQSIDDGENTDGDDSAISAANVLVKLTLSGVRAASERHRTVFVCDTSGSMRGRPRSLVEATVAECVQLGSAFDVINYSLHATLLTGPSVDVQLRQTWMGGCTNFRAAFVLMRDIINDSGADVTKLDFVFLTDGQPSDRPLDRHGSGIGLPQLREAVADRLAVHGRHTVIHCFALGSSADNDLLELLRLAGSTPGVFSFAAAHDTAVTSELTSLLSYASTARELPVSVDGAPPQSVAFFSSNENDDDDKNSKQLTGELWTAAVPSCIVVGDGQQVLSGDAITVQQCSDDDDSDDAAFVEYAMQRLRRDVYLCRTARHVLQIERRIAAVRSRLPRYLRAQLLLELADVDSELADVRRLLADQASQRLGAKSDLVARCKAISFRGAMGKARRQRLLDKRTLANQRLLRSVDEQLRALPPLDEAQAAALEAQALLRDDISHESVADIMLQSTSDLLTVGLDVQRDETVVDQPVTVRVRLGNTLVSWLTLEQAADYQLNRGNTDAIGVFSAASSTARLLTGMSNEPINAGLPLFCSEQHYQRVRVMLPVLCSYFFTLCPTGFAVNQLPALFAVLARLHRQADSERARAIVEQYRLVCQRIMHDDELMQRLRVPDDMQPRHIVRLFATSAHSREKSELPSLDILYGCLLASGDDDGDGDEQPPHLQHMIVAEALRRRLNAAMAAQHKGGDYFTPQLQQLLYGEDARRREPDVAVTSAAALLPDGRFAPPVFADYAPLPLRPAVTEALLAALDLPATVDELVRATGAVGVALTQHDYERLLLGAVLQAAYAPSNDRYAQLVADSLALLDPLDDAAVQRLLRHVDAQFDAQRRERWQARVRQQDSEETALFLAFGTESVADFVAASSAAALSRGKKLWHDLVALVVDDDHWPLLPANAAKLAVMLSGRDADGAPVIENGAAWMAGPVAGAFCRRRLRASPFAHIIDQLDDMSLEHQYRLSDRPNRHGHHLSYPLWIAKPDNPSIKNLRRRWDR